MHKTAGACKRFAAGLPDNFLRESIVVPEEQICLQVCQHTGQGCHPRADPGEEESSRCCRECTSFAFTLLEVIARVLVRPGEEASALLLASARQAPAQCVPPSGCVATAYSSILAEVARAHTAGQDRRQSKRDGQWSGCCQGC